MDTLNTEQPTALVLELEEVNTAMSTQTYQVDWMQWNQRAVAREDPVMVGGHLTVKKTFIGGSK